jgi:hypothetical protein
MLVECDLSDVLWICFLDTVTIKRAPTLVVDALTFPQTWISDVSDLRPVDEDAVGVAGQHAFECGELQAIVGREREPGSGEVLARSLLEVVSSIKDVSQSRRMLGITHPVELDPAQAFVPDGAGTEIATRRLRDHGGVNQRIDGDADRRSGALCGIEVGHVISRTTAVRRPSPLRPPSPCPMAAGV